MQLPHNSCIQQIAIRYFLLVHSATYHKLVSRQTESHPVGGSLQLELDVRLCVVSARRPRDYGDAVSAGAVGRLTKAAFRGAAAAEIDRHRASYHRRRRRKLRK